MYSPPPPPWNIVKPKSLHREEKDYGRGSKRVIAMLLADKGRGRQESHEPGLLSIIFLDWVLTDLTNNHRLQRLYRDFRLLHFDLFRMWDCTAPSPSWTVCWASASSSFTAQGMRGWVVQVPTPNNQSPNTETVPRMSALFFHRLSICERATDHKYIKGCSHLGMKRGQDQV